MAAQVGIWLDKRVAKIVRLDGGNVSVALVESEVEEFRPKGGSGTRFKGGPQDVVQDSKYTERKKHQLKNYFNAIVKQLPEHDQLVVFGPSQTKIHFVEELQRHHQHVHHHLVDVVNADSMTDNQIRAWVETYFLKHEVS